MRGRKSPKSGTFGPSAGMAGYVCSPSPPRPPCTPCPIPVEIHTRTRLIKDAAVGEAVGRGADKREALGGCSALKASYTGS